MELWQQSLFFFVYADLTSVQIRETGSRISCTRQIQTGSHALRMSEYDVRRCEPGIWKINSVFMHAMKWFHNVV